MKRKPPSYLQRFIVRWMRRFKKYTVGLEAGPGEHSCWKCKLYDQELQACRIIVDRGKFAPKDAKGRRITELRRVWPFDFCIRILDKDLDRLVVFDPDLPEHQAGKAMMQEAEEVAKRRAKNDEDQKLIDLIGSMNKKNGSAAVSSRETSLRGDPWLFTNANDAGGPQQTSRN